MLGPPVLDGGKNSDGTTVHTKQMGQKSADKGTPCRRDRFAVFVQFAVYRFDEFYYWDTCFINKGLIADGRYEDDNPIYKQHQINPSSYLRFLRYDDTHGNGEVL